jgi:hypothetical protein
VANGDGKGLDPKTILSIIVVVFQTILMVFGYEIRSMTKSNASAIVVLQVKVAELEGGHLTDDEGLLIWKELGQKADKKDVPPADVLRRLESLENKLRGRAVAE